MSDSYYCDYAYDAAQELINDILAKDAAINNATPGKRSPQNLYDSVINVMNDFTNQLKNTKI